MKISLSSILGSFASVVGLNSRFQQIEDELNDKVLYRDNPVGEANEMNNDLDMNGNDLVNVGTLTLDGLNTFMQGLTAGSPNITVTDNADGTWEVDGTSLGGGDVFLAGNNTFSGDNTFSGNDTFNNDITVDGVLLKGKVDQNEADIASNTSAIAARNSDNVLIYNTAASHVGGTDGLTKTITGSEVLEAGTYTYQLSVDGQLQGIPDSTTETWTFKVKPTTSSQLKRGIYHDRYTESYTPSSLYEQSELVWVSPSETGDLTLPMTVSSQVGIGLRNIVGTKTGTLVLSSDQTLTLESVISNVALTVAGIKIFITLTKVDSNFV